MIISLVILELSLPRIRDYENGGNMLVGKFFYAPDTRKRSCSRIPYYQSFESITVGILLVIVAHSNEFNFP